MSGRASTSIRLCPCSSMRKSAATTASPSTTRLTARLSGTNHFGRSRGDALLDLVRPRGVDPHQAEVTTFPGAAASQSAGKRSNISPENGRGSTPSAKTV